MYVVREKFDLPNTDATCGLPIMTLFPRCLRVKWLLKRGWMAIGRVSLVACLNRIGGDLWKQVGIEECSSFSKMLQNQYLIAKIGFNSRRKWIQ